MHRNPKRHNAVDMPVCVSAVLTSSCVLDPVAPLDELREVQLKRQKQWHLEQGKQGGVQCAA